MIPGLDGLRAIAFLLVFGFHTDYLPFGWMGVQLFFVLSGFLITSILVRMRENQSMKGYFIKFYGRRFLRIFPLYYFYLFLMWGFTLWLLSIGFRPMLMKLFQTQLPYALGYLYNFHYAAAEYKHLHFLVHFWSLSVEEQFYLFWPLLVFFIPSRARKSFFALIVIATPLLRIGFVMARQYSLFPFLNATIPMGLYPLTFNHMDAFGIGALIALWNIPWARLQWIILTISLPIAAYLWQFFAAGTLGPANTLGYEFIMPVAYQYIWGYTAMNYYFALLIYLVAKEGMFTRFLQLKPLMYIGKISYGLYVYHNGVIWFMLRVRDLGVGDEFVKPVSTILAFVVTLALASLTYRFVEAPFLQLKDKYFSLSPSLSE